MQLSYRFELILDPLTPSLSPVGARGPQGTALTV